MNQKHSAAGAFLAILPAIVLGMLAMICEGVSPMLWVQQAAAFALCLVTVLPMRRAAKKVSPDVLSVLLSLFLLASLFGAGAGGARRWVNLAVFNVNAAMLVLPALLVLLGGMRHIWLLLFVSAVLCIQPDFSQLTALMAASIPLILCRGKKIELLCIAAQAALAAICFFIPTSIEPVAYCEGVLTLLGTQSAWLLMAGAASLIVIPALWARRFFAERHVWMLSLAVYYAAAMLFALSGEYPMPFMGFGLSPILGYWLAVVIHPEA